MAVVKCQLSYHLQVRIRVSVELTVTGIVERISSERPTDCKEHNDDRTINNANDKQYLFIE
jgi:hypothetical protein